MTPNETAAKALYENNYDVATWEAAEQEVKVVWMEKADVVIGAYLAARYEQQLKPQPEAPTIHLSDLMKEKTHYHEDRNHSNQG